MAYLGCDELMAKTRRSLDRRVETHILLSRLRQSPSLDQVRSTLGDRALITHLAAGEEINARLHELWDGASANNARELERIIADVKKEPRLDDTNTSATSQL